MTSWRYGCGSASAAGTKSSSKTIVPPLMSARSQSCATRKVVSDGSSGRSALEERPRYSRRMALSVEPSIQLAVPPTSSLAIPDEPMKWMQMPSVTPRTSGSDRNTAAQQM